MDYYTVFCELERALKGELDLPNPIPTPYLYPYLYPYPYPYP